MVPKGGLERLIPLSHFTEQFANVVICAFFSFHIWSIELTRATQLGIKWTLISCNWASASNMNSTANSSYTLSPIPDIEVSPTQTSNVRLHVNNSGSGGRFGIALPAAFMAQ